MLQCSQRALLRHTAAHLVVGSRPHHLSSSSRRPMSDSSSRKRKHASLTGQATAHRADGSGALNHNNHNSSSIQHEVGPTFKVPGLLVTDHTFRVPLDHSGRVPGQVTVFARELVAPVNARRQQPYLLYLQGGPGFESPRPTEASGWLKVATSSFRVVLMDQRGTGRSSPITTNSLLRCSNTLQQHSGEGGDSEGDGSSSSAEQQAEYLGFFRADSIVADAELIRKALVPPDNTGGKWSILGQSFGGFCCLTYLSMAPEGLTEVLTTGGIPPAVSEACSAERVYQALYPRVLAQNDRYYARFPQDVEVVGRIVSFLAAQPGGGLELPSGSRLTPRAFQLLGLSGLGSGGGFERLHYLLESFFESEDQVNPAFIKAYESWMSWGTNPLYALLHEAIYCQGTGAPAASNWAAHRVRQQHFAAEFDAVAAAREGRPVNFTGEMVYPWMFEDFSYLRPFKGAADLVAARQDWGLLYSTDALQHNKVPVAAATYLDDMYVDYNLAQETLAGVPGVRQWVTNEFKHSGIRDDGGRILDRLLGMVRDVLLLE